MPDGDTPPQGRQPRTFDRFDYRGYRGCRCHCALEVILLADGRTVVIAIELEANPGTSITNVAEYLASFVCDRFWINPEKLVWIEHYAYGSAMKALAERTYDLVTFTLRKRDRIVWSQVVLDWHPDGWPGYFDELSWRPMSDDDWLAFGLTPRQPVKYERKRR